MVDCFLIIMPHILQHKQLTLHLELPKEGYQSSRFDWTGKITQVWFQGIPVTTTETADTVHLPHHGRGFFNEFGIESPLGFHRASIGDWCHKIGVGLIKKATEHYDFHHQYEIAPARFTVERRSDQVIIQCFSELVDGYAYRLQKFIRIVDTGFRIMYLLHNLGTRSIETTEYSHNFIGIDGDPIGSNYELSMPFSLYPEQFEEAVNPEAAVIVGKNSFSFPKRPSQPFFFGRLGEKHAASEGWKLVHRPSQLCIREVTSHAPSHFNLWGWKHVISPEVFIPISLPPGQQTGWARQFQIGFAAPS